MNRIKLAIAACGAIVVLGAAGYAGDRAMNAWAARQVDAILAQPPFTKASHGAVTYRPWRREVEIAELSVETSVPLLHSAVADTLVLDGIDFTRQQFASGVAKNAAIVSGGAGGEVRTETAALRVAGLDLSAWQRAIAPESGADAAPLRLLDQLEMADVKVSTGKLSGTIGAVRLAGLSLRPGGGGDDATTAAQYAAWLARIGIDEFELSGFALGTPEDIGYLALGRLHLAQLAPGRLGGLELEKVAGKLPLASWRIGALALNGLVYDVASAQPRLFLSEMRLTDCGVGTQPGAEVTIKELHSTMTGDLDNTTAAVQELHGLAVPASFAPPLQLLGYDEIVVDYDSHSGYDLEQKRVEHDVTLAAADAGRLTLALRISNYDGIAARDVAGFLNRVSDLRLDALELHYEDASLVGRLFKYYGEKTGKDAEAARAEFAAEITRRYADASDPGVKASIDNLLAFLREPGAITVKLAPPQPLAMADLLTLAKLGPDAAATRLGLTIH